MYPIVAGQKTQQRRGDARTNSGGKVFYLITEMM